MNEEAGKYYFVSDLHLDYKKGGSDQEDIFIEFLDYLKNQSAKKLFIVGDLFDCWIEYKQVVPKGFYKLFTKISELKKAGTEIVYFSGNHDFWKGTYFRDEFGIEINFKPISLEINGKKFYIHHGDGLAYKDTGYKIAKHIMKNRFSQYMYSILHPDIGIRLAKHSSASSRRYSSKKNYSKRDGLKDFAMNKLKEGFDYIVMGHRHLPQKLTENGGIYINLGDWIENYSYAMFNGVELILYRFYDNSTKKILFNEKIY